MTQQEEIRLPVAGGRDVLAHLALPEGLQGPVPGVLILHEILGLNDDIRRIAGQFAEAGYAALAPDLFEGRGPKPVCIVRVAANVAKGEGPVVDDMLAARSWLANHPRIDGERLAVAGFCMGGGFALLLGTIASFRVAAPHYGEVKRNPESYRDICPVVGGYGGRDMVFARKGQLLKSHLEALGVPHDVKIYDEAGHSYMSQHAPWRRAVGPFTPLRGRYHEEAAEDSWRRILAFFQAHLDGQDSGDDATSGSK